MLNRLEIFKDELEQIKRDDIKLFVTKAIYLLPTYFFEVPASSTGKYHPTYSLGEGGLVRHTKALIKIAIELFNCNTMFNFTSDEKDMIIVACILHDGAKSGVPQQKYTAFDHPLIIANLIRNNEAVMSCVSNDIAETILGAIETHMGQWNTSNYSNTDLPKPQTDIQKFVHLVDYLGSRKCLEVNFNAFTSRSDI